MSKSRNFCVWHTGRCGSTILSSMINQHSQLHSAGEVLEKLSKLYRGIKYKPGAWSGSKLCIRYAILKEKAEIFGLEIKVWHLFQLGVSVSQVMEFLQKLNVDKHIILKRQNYLRVIASSNVAKKTSSWHVKAETKPALTKVYVDPKGLAYAIQKFSDYYEELSLSLGQKCLWLIYEEDILKNPRVAFNKVARFLELNELEPMVSLGVTNPYPLKDIIINFDEISLQLRGTEQEWMLES